ncbi:MAG: toll/interleukin-1 receptor domain-containing protein [Chloroflexi bacterium]|nr:toll/interleukin-1 receptor domain-containing protein [Chloroflexota bacterium]
MTDVFISYAHEDTQFVDQLADALNENGIRPWRDKVDIAAGANWEQTVDRALAEADVLLLVISPASMRSGPVKHEWSTFLKSGKPIVPILWVDTALPKALEKLIYLHFDNQPFADAFPVLLSELHGKGIRAYQPATPAASAQKPKSEGTGFANRLTLIGLLVAVLSVAATIAQPFIADWLSTEPSVTATSTAQPTTASQASLQQTVSPAATLVSLTAGSSSATLILGGENNLTLLFNSESDVTNITVGSPTGVTFPIASSFAVFQAGSNRAAAGTCLHFYRENTNGALPRQCIVESTFEVSLTAADVFWYDDARNRAIDLTVKQSDLVIKVCTTAQPRCDLQW